MDVVLPVWDQLVTFFSVAWEQWGLKVLLFQIILNVVFAIMAAIKSGNYDWTKLTDFLWKKVLPYAGGYILAKAFGTGAGYSWLAESVLAVLMLKLWIDLADNLKVLGIPIPEFLLLGKPSGPSR